MIVDLSAEVGSFAESKEVAKRLRTKFVLPSIMRSEEVTLDFTGVSLATQSFVHALIAEAVRSGDGVGLDYLVFKGCEPHVRSIIEVVVSYCQDDWGAELHLPDGDEESE